MLHHPSYLTSAGEEFADLAGSAGLILDPYQRLALMHGLGMQARGRWAAMLVALWLSRQNGKGGIAEALELGWMFLTHEPLIMHSAHEYKTSQEAFLRIKGRIESTPDLDRRVNRYWQANGEQGIELTKKHGGSRLRFIARSRTSGRGFTGSKNVADEAQELEAQQMAAVLPTMAAMDNPQVWFFGTPPRDGSAWCYTLRELGESQGRIVWLDFGADLDLDDEADRERVLDRALWYECNPALGGRISETFCEEVELIMGIDHFAKERLGVWPKRLGAGGGTITEAVWSALADPGSRRVGDVAFAVDMNPARTHTSIAAWGRRADDRGHAELVEYRAGTRWVVERMLELHDRHDPVGWALDAKGPVGSLVADIERAGITRPEDKDRPHRGHLAIPTSAEVAAACGQLLDAVKDGTFAHIDQAPLNVAAVMARTRAIGDAQGLARQSSTVDISPLVAVQLARWLFEARADDDYDVMASIG